MGTTGASTMITGFHSSVFSYAETPLNVGVVNRNVYTNAPEGTAETFAFATAAAADALVAFNNLASRPDGIDPGAGQLGGLTLLPGVYKAASGAFLITGSDLTLDAQGNADAVWIFQMASSLTVGTPLAPSSALLVNGAQAANVCWQIGSAGMTFSTAGNGFINVENNGGALAATNTGNGRVTVNAAGAAAITLTHTGDEDFIYYQRHSD
jgi:hypothetical protein